MGHHVGIFVQTLPVRRCLSKVIASAVDLSARYFLAQSEFLKLKIAVSSLSLVFLKVPLCGQINEPDQRDPGYFPRTIDAIFSRACLRGFEPNGPTLKVLPEHLEDAPRSGRPRKQEAIHEPTVDKSLRLRRLSYHGVESPQGSRIQEDEADEEAWVDEEDETR
ncbi:HTH-Tnp-Tc3-2 multi-domain protein [Pyrenophora tritici-repentis]|nr:HTH-Tnp-Tc3-2 multi-domain protein [Pyrenophora tritici-repentis]